MDISFWLIPIQKLRETEMDNLGVKKVHRGSLILSNWLIGIIGLDMMIQIIFGFDEVCPSKV